jgi:predicted RNA polymerase sigma factor
MVSSTRARTPCKEALFAAARQWPAEGVPDRPRSWLLTVAGRCLVDRWRADSARRRREIVAALDPSDNTPAADLHDTNLHDTNLHDTNLHGADRDDTLGLLFLCCHPALSPPSQLALTLRAVGGLTTAEIAVAFLVPEATIAKRIGRAKQREDGSGQVACARVAIRAPNCARSRLWSASDNAVSGSGCTSMSRPWLPTAWAARDIGAT